MPVKQLTICAMLMAMTVIMSASFMSVPVPGGHMYLNEVVIVIASVLLPPGYAFIVGGVGAFLGDLLFYPAPMFVSLVTHGVQALVISLFVHRIHRDKPVRGSLIGTVLGVVICVVGYTVGRAFLYSTPEYAIMKLPFQILQSVAGSGLGLLLCWKAGVVKIYHRFCTV